MPYGGCARFEVEHMSYKLYQKYILPLEMSNPKKFDKTSGLTAYF